MRTEKAFLMDPFYSFKIIRLKKLIMLRIDCLRQQNTLCFAKSSADGDKLCKTICRERDPFAIELWKWKIFMNKTEN